MNEYGSIDGGTTTRDYDQNGNLVDTDRYEQGDWTKRKQFTYDAFNRLVEVKEAGVLRARYAYDHKGRRVRREVNWNPLVDSTIDETVNYYYLGNQVIEEQDESGVTQRQYVWGGGTLLQMKAANGAVTETVYAHENAYGSVIKTTRVVAGAPVAHSHSDYDAYGGSAYFTAPLIAELPYRLRGMRYDPETSFYSISNGAYYNPALGSFLSRVLVSPAFSRYAIAVSLFASDIFLQQQNPVPVAPCIPQSIDWEAAKGTKSTSTDSAANLNYSDAGRGYAVFGFDTVVQLAPHSGPWTGCTYYQFVRGFQLGTDHQMKRWGAPAATTTPGLAVTLAKLGAATAQVELTPFERANGARQHLQQGYSLDGMSSNGSKRYFTSIHQRSDGKVVWLDQPGSYEAGDTKSMAFLDFQVVVVGNDQAKTKVSRKMRVVIMEALNRGELQRDRQYFTP